MRSALLAVTLLFCACGPTVGDPCTISTQCGAGICINYDFTPGGYCSRACNPGKDDCPTGSVCVPDAIARGTAGCMLSCTKQSQCRNGYVCRAENGSATSICVGPQGI